MLIYRPKPRQFYEECAGYYIRIDACWSTKRFCGIEVQVCQHRKGYESAEMLYAKEE